MNNVNMVIQALLWKAEKPMSGYDIAKAIEDKTGNSHQQIYRELAKIAEREDVTVELIEQSDRPNKKVYSVDKSFVFIHSSGSRSDFTKTPVAYEILVKDILDGTNHYDRYIECMTDNEFKFLEMMGNES